MLVYSMHASIILTNHSDTIMQHDVLYYNIIYYHIIYYSICAIV